MELLSVQSTQACQIAGPIFYNDNVIGVFDGRHVLGTVRRSSVTAWRTEYRTSFKHPVVGLVLAIIMLGVPLQSLLGDPLHLWWLTSMSMLRIIASMCMVLIGLYLLFELIRRRDLPWIVFNLGVEEQAFALKAELPPEAVDAVNQMIQPGPHRR